MQFSSCICFQNFEEKLLFTYTASKRTKRGKQAEDILEDVEDTQAVDGSSDVEVDEEEPSRKLATKKPRPTKNVIQSVLVVHSV